MNNEIECHKCTYFQQDLIFKLQETEEYKRSLAISEAINFLLAKIKNLEDKKKQILIHNSKLEEMTQVLKEELDTKNENILNNREEFIQKEFILMNKIDSLSDINSMLENKVRILEEENSSYLNRKEEKERSFKNIVNEYKNSIENYRNESENLRLENENLKEKIEKMENEIRQRDVRHRKLVSEMEESYKSEINSIKERENQLCKKLKELEVLLYKLDLENQNYRENLKNVNRKNIQNASSVDMSKTDLVNEIKNVENVMKTINMSSENVDFDINYKNRKIENMNIEEIAAEIKKTELELKNCSYSLQTHELSTIDKENSGALANNKNDFREYMNILEDKAEYLFNLKKRYNILYKKLNNL